CRAGAVHSTQRQGTYISGIVDVRHTPSSRDGQVKGEPLEAKQHCYPVAIDIKSATSWVSSCPCNSRTKTLCHHTAALLYQWLTRPAAFIVVPSVSAEADAAVPERKETEVVEKDATHTEPGAVATK